MEGPPDFSEFSAKKKDHSILKPGFWNGVKTPVIYFLHSLNIMNREVWNLLSMTILELVGVGPFPTYSLAL